MLEKFNLKEMLEDIARDEELAKDVSSPTLVSQDDIAALLQQHLPGTASDESGTAEDTDQ